MILVVPDGMHPLAARAASDTRMATASLLVAQALEGITSWDAAWQALEDRMKDAPTVEVVLLQHIIQSAQSPARLQDALLPYVKHLSHREGLVGCAAYFAELARTLAPKPSDELLMELATLYRQSGRFLEARDVWSELELRGQQEHHAWLSLRARIGKGIIERHMGNLGLAENIFLLVSAAARDYPDLRAMARNGLGTVYDHSHPRRYEEAADAYWDAYTIHPTETDGMRWRFMMNAGCAAVGCENYTLADYCFRIVASKSDCWQDITNCLIERLDVCSALADWGQVGDIKDALRFRLDRLTPDMAIDYRYRMGLVELRGGRNPATWWVQAKALASAHRLFEWEKKLDEALAAPPAPPEPVESPRLKRAYADAFLYCVTAGL